MSLVDPEPKSLNLIHSVPQVRLSGSVDDLMLDSFMSQIANVPTGEEPVVVELMSLGGGAETGRRLALEIGIARERLGRRIVFLGKTAVYSAAVTIMSGFPRVDRFLSPDAVLLIHCRRLEMTLELNGPLKAHALRLKELTSEIEIGLRLEQEGFANLVRDTQVSMQELMERAPANWYMHAEEEAARQIVAGLV
jgi:ATP-dependent Clp protease protease subunit